MSPGSRSAEVPPDFTQDAVQSIVQLREAFSGVLASLDGAPSRSPTKLGRFLKIDTKLAWKVTNFVNEKDPFVSAHYVPRAAAIQLFLQAAARTGAPKEKIEGVNQASQDFDEMVKRHGGSRGSVERLFAGHVSGKSAKIQREHRRKAYLAGSVIWGIQTKALTHGVLMMPSEDPALLDIATLKGFQELCTIRPDVSWRVHRMHAVNTTDGLRTPRNRQALDLEEGTDDDSGPAWLREFSSQPLPTCHRSIAPDGTTVYQLAPQTVGNTGTIDFFTGERVTGMTHRYGNGEDRFLLTLLANGYTPTELFVFDVWIHRSLELLNPRFKLLAGLFIHSVAEAVESDYLPTTEEIEEYSPQDADPELSEVPSWGAAVRWSFERMGQDIAEFRQLRLRVPYLPIPTLPGIAFDLPLPPKP